MNGSIFYTMADELYAVADSRILYAELHFGETAYSDVKEAACEFKRFIAALTEANFVTRWTFNGKAIAEGKLTDAVTASQGAFDFFSEGNVITPYIYDQKTLRAFQKTLEFDAALPRSETSEDFIPYLEEHFCGREFSEASLKKEILALFHAPHRINRGFYNTFDLQSSFACHPHSLLSGMFYGEASIELGLGCVKGSAQAFAQELASFAKRICTALKNANAQIGIAPWPRGQYISPYMRYFGASPHVPEADGQTSAPRSPAERYSHRYLCGAEWGNVISKQTRRLLPALAEHAKLFPGILCEEQANGGVYVQADKDIQEIDVMDLYAVRMLLDAALYPGESKRYPVSALRDIRNKGFLPRGQWEIVPIYESEIVIDNDEFYFKKAGMT